MLNTEISNNNFGSKINSGMVNGVGIGKQEDLYINNNKFEDIYSPILMNSSSPSLTIHIRDNEAKNVRSSFFAGLLTLDNSLDYISIIGNRVKTSGLTTKFININIPSNLIEIHDNLFQDDNYIGQKIRVLNSNKLFINHKDELAFNPNGILDAILGSEYFDSSSGIKYCRKTGGSSFWNLEIYTDTIPTTVGYGPGDIAFRNNPGQLSINKSGFMGWILIQTGNVKEWVPFGEISKSLNNPRFGSSLPISAIIGDFYYLTSSSTLYFFNGSWIPLLPNASTSVKGLVNQSTSSADTATALSATYSLVEIQGILTELRDLKVKLRAAGIMAS